MRDRRDLTIFALGLTSAFLAGALLGKAGGTPPAWAQQAQDGATGGTVSSNQRMIAATGSVGSGMSVLWLVDTEARKLLVYGSGSLGKNVELRAARDIEWDFKLRELNDDSQYKSEDLRRLFEQKRRRAPGDEGGGTGEAGSEPEGE